VENDGKLWKMVEMVENCGKWWKMMKMVKNCGKWWKMMKNGGKCANSAFSTISPYHHIYFRSFGGFASASFFICIIRSF
jgi:hypothetical protein